MSIIRYLSHMHREKVFVPRVGFEPTSHPVNTNFLHGNDNFSEFLTGIRKDSLGDFVSPWMATKPSGATLP